MSATSDSKAVNSRAKKQEREDLIKKREQQLSDYQTAIETLQNRINDTISAKKECEALSNHSKGFYDEIDKLTKGKALIGVTDITVALVNDIIKDAKKSIKNDPHLDRIKEFVPAGDNPVYPDVLIVVRTVRESLDRHRKRQNDTLDRLRAQLQIVRTVIGALQFYLNDNANAQPREKEVPSKENIRPYVDGYTSDSCFTKYLDSQEKYFDFGRLDSESVEEYISLSPEPDVDQSGDGEMMTKDEGSGTDENSV